MGINFLPSTNNFSTSSGGSSSSTGVAYDLISEGPIELVNGLSGIYFNRTPIVNESVSSSAQANEVGVTLNGTGPFTVEVLASFPAGLELPIIVLNGLAEGTVSSSTDTTVTATSFFTNAMINGSSGDGTLVPKLRIKEANLDGSDYVGSVISYTSNTATVSPPIPTNAAGKRINFDLFTSAIATPLSIQGSDYSFSTLQIASVPNSANIKARADARVLFDSISGNLPGSSTDDKNFKYVSVNFRSGTLGQLPVKNLPSFTAASLGYAVNQEIKQLTSNFNRSLGNFWGKYTLKRPSGAIGGAEVVINASSVAPGSISEVDELLLTLSAPNGLYAANSEGKPRSWGAVFQIIFKYTNGSVSKEALVFGPTDAEIAAASILVAADNGVFRKNGGDPTGTIRAASKTALDFDFRWSLEQYKPFTDFQVIVRKVTTDNLEYNNDIIVATTTVKALQAFINDKLSYPHSAYAAVAFDSLEFAGNFPERGYRCRGVRTELPTNYVTREEASDGIAKYTRNGSTVTNNYQIWNGTFRKGYSNNPIWNLREMLLNKRWGLGHWVDPSLINNYSFYSLARYCDELVPDGKGGLEPRFTCGVYLREPVEAYKIIRDFCTMMLSIPYWVDGQMIIEADRPAEPVYTFTKGNIEGGIFSYEGTGNKTRPNQIAVRFNNKDNFYEQDLELVDDVEDMVKQNRIFTEEVTAFGATTRGQAIRYGKWKLLTSKLQKEVISFKTGENGAYLKPGSVVNIQDADRNSVRYSGRLVSATTNSVVLDSAVSLPSGNEYTLHVFIPGAAVYLVQDSVTLAEGTFTRGALLPATIGGVLVDTEEEASKIVDSAGNPVDVQFVDDAHIESKVISGIPLSGTNLSVIGNFTVAPGAETVWAITVKNNGALVAGSAKQYKILSIGEESPGLYNITAAEHFNSKFDLIDEEFLATSPRTVPRYEEVPSIIDFSAKIITSRQTSDDLANTQVPGIELNWVGPGVYTNNILGLYPDFDLYVLEIKDPQNNITIQNFPKSATTYTLNSALEGRYEFTLRARSSLGPSSPPSRVSIAVITPSTKNSNLVATLPRGGTFSKPINVGASSITAPSSYRFTAESGVSVIYSDTAPRVTSGTYWSNGSGVFLWDGTSWIVISGTFPNGLFSILDSFTLSAVGSVGNALTGSLSSTLGNVTVSGAGSVPFVGSLSSTLGDITVSGTGSVPFVGSLSSTLGNVTVSGTGSVSDSITGSLSSTLGDVTVSGTGSVPFIGSLSSTLGDITVSGTGSVSGSITGSLSSTLGDVTVSGTGSVPFIGSLSSTLGNVTVSGTGTVGSAGIRTAPTYHSSSFSSGDFQADRPSGTVSGDLLVGFFLDSAGGTIGIPAGWTAVGSQITQGISTGRIAYKIAGGSEPTNYSFTSSPSDYPVGFIARYTNYDTSNPLTLPVGAAGTGTTRTIASVTSPFVNGDLLAFAADGDSGTYSVPPSGMTEIQNVDGNSNAGFFRQAIAAAGATGTKTQTQSISDIWATIAVVVNGAPFDSWTINAWNPDAGSNSSGIVPDAIGSAPLYAAVGTTLKNNWDGEIDSADITTLVALPADISAFNNDGTCTITFWALYRSTTNGFCGLINHAPVADLTSGSAPTGTWRIERQGSSAFSMLLRTPSFQGGGTSTSSSPANDTWAMYTVRLGANEWRATLNNDHANAVYLAWSDAVKGSVDHVLKFGGYPLNYYANEIADGVGSSENGNQLTADVGFRGRFGDIRIHNKILSDAEINALYTAGRKSY